ncbi:MAG: PHB depolymerase family esterase [Eubacteriales bacterium]|nr:PHB depolymerase family esterase [Eubacteriales bacterium]
MKDRFGKRVTALALSSVLLTGAMLSGCSSSNSSADTGSASNTAQGSGDAAWKVTVAGESENRMVSGDSTEWLVAEVPIGTQSVDVYAPESESDSVIINEQSVEPGDSITVELMNGYQEVSIGEGDDAQSLLVRYEIDPDNPYQTLYAGEHTQTVELDNGESRTFTAYVPEGARESTAGVFVLPDQDENVYDKWTTFADNMDSTPIDEEWATQQEKMILIYLDNLTYGTSEEEREADIDYVNKVYAMASGRSLYCIHEAKNYLVGYGDGGTIAQMAAMDQTAVWAGLTTVGAGEVNEDWIAQNGEEIVTSLNGYNTESSSTRESTIVKNTVPLPVWIINNDESETDDDTLEYWLDANQITEDAAQDTGIMKYVRTKDWTEEEQAYSENRDIDAYRVWVSDEPEDDDLEAAIWNQFLYGVRRWMADPCGDLRMTLDPIADQNMTRHYENVDGWMREWYVYTPDNIDTNSEDVPVVFAMHGYTLNGAVYSGQTDWPKVANENGVIVIFPSAINGSISANGNAPFPAWNLSQDPTRMDDVGFVQYMLEDLDKEYDVDLSRVYATGHSWGSQMTHLLALEMPETFAAVAPLSGFVFNSAIWEKIDEKLESGTFAGIPVYMAAGTEGDTEWSICPLPLAEDNSSGQSLTAWTQLNQCTDSVDWNEIGNGWLDNDAYEQDGRWYTLNYEKDGIPMVRVEIVDYMPHATMTEHTNRVWNDWMSHFSRGESGEVQYQE